MDVVKVPPNFYIHVMDTNTNVTRVEVGPQTFTKQDHERIVVPATSMVIIPANQYVIIEDPAVRVDGVVQRDRHDQVIVKYGDREIRFGNDWTMPFPLQPGERMGGQVQEVPLILPDSALLLRCARDFKDGKVSRRAGDEYLFKGPGAYHPRVEEEQIRKITSTIIAEGTALRLRASREFTRDGEVRHAGEEWLERRPGAYLPEVEETVVGTVEPDAIKPNLALHLRALESFTDIYGVERKAGEEWLVTTDQSSSHLCDVYEQRIKSVTVTVLKRNHFCIVVDPVDIKTGKNKYGVREVRRGPATFFLKPFERLESGICDVHVLGEDSALLVKATEGFTDDTNQQRRPGDLWLVRGPCEYVPRVEVEVVEPRFAIPLDESEGIYVRDIQSGQVRCVTGETYLLKATEELWEKQLSQQVEKLLGWTHYVPETKQRGGRRRQVRVSDAPQRDKTKCVVFRVPHNAAVQLYDYKTKTSRVEFGPGRVMLQPEEKFSLVTLSGGKPKRPNRIHSLAMMLGPDFMTDILEVETSDHARLRLQLSYNWQFKLDDPAELKGKAFTDMTDAEKKLLAEHRNVIGAKIFNVRDFVGDACKALASLVRGSVASQTFDNFHKNSARIIRTAVFGFDEETKKIRDEFLFTSNNLLITNVDIQSVEPVDDRTRESLQKSVQLAIKITTRKQERRAQQVAEEIRTKSQGEIVMQRIANDRENEIERQNLERLKAEVAAVQSTGTAKATAAAESEYSEIEVKADVENARMQAEAEAILSAQRLEAQANRQSAELKYNTALAHLDIKKTADLAEIETEKFAAMVSAITKEAIQAIARAGPEMQAKLLKGLGLKGYLLTDGNSPVNLFNTAKGMVAAPSKSPE
jgi:major vault protein